jgi:hypothetical protein
MNIAVVQLINGRNVFDDALSKKNPSPGMKNNPLNQRSIPGAAINSSASNTWIDMKIRNGRCITTGFFFEA